jgi:hypothetical protein
MQGIERPIVICPGCLVAMTVVAARQFDTTFEELTYRCPTYAAEALRVHQSGDGAKSGFARK